MEFQESANDVTSDHNEVKADTAHSYGGSCDYIGDNMFATDSLMMIWSNYDVQPYAKTDDTHDTDDGHDFA